MVYCSLCGSIHSLRTRINRDSNPPFTLEVGKVPLKKALKRTSGQGQAGLYYNLAVLPDKTVSINLQAVPLGSTLRRVLVGTALEVVTSGQNILLRPKKETAQVQLPSASSQETITGMVTDRQSG